MNDLHQLGMALEAADEAGIKGPPKVRRHLAHRPACGSGSPKVSCGGRN